MTDHAGRECNWEGNVKGWALKDNPDEQCVKKIGYYQWIPYVLLIQVHLISIYEHKLRKY